MNLYSVIAYSLIFYLARKKASSLPLVPHSSGFRHLSWHVGTASVQTSLGFTVGMLARAVLPHGQWVTRCGWSAQPSQGPGWHWRSHWCRPQSRSRPHTLPHKYCISKDSWLPQSTERVCFPQQHVYAHIHTRDKITHTTVFPQISCKWHHSL